MHDFGSEVLAIFAAIFFFWWMWTSGSVMNVQMRVHQWTLRGTYTPNIRNSSTHLHSSEKEHRGRNRSKKYKCIKRAFSLYKQLFHEIEIQCKI
jgi:hypothetical protein